MPPKEDQAPEQPKVNVQEEVNKAIAPLQERIASLEGELKAKTGEFEQSKSVWTEKESRIGDFDRRIGTLTAEKDGIVKQYGELVRKTNPAVPADMITGATVDEINASLNKGLGFVDQVKKNLDSDYEAKRKALEEQAQETRVPPGAPGRTEPDTSTMSSKEKITFGLNKARKK